MDLGLLMFNESSSFFTAFFFQFKISFRECICLGGERFDFYKQNLVSLRAKK